MRSHVLWAVKVQKLILACVRSVHVRGGEMRGAPRAASERVDVACEVALTTFQGIVATIAEHRRAPKSKLG